MNEQAIFLAALDIPDLQERRAYLEKACAGDVNLQQQVESLLAAHERSGEFLDMPAYEQIAQPNDATLNLKQESPPVAKPTNPLDTQAESSDDDSDEVALNFLEPSTKPGSLGRLAQYEVLEILGKGGFGTVVRAFDEKLQRVVAIKIMSPQMAATSPPRKRFLREARASAKIRHENVVAIYDIQEQPVPYLVMEYIPGETLQQKLDRVGPFDVMETLRVGQQIAAGLAAAHAEGLIHRDIKPANILLESGLVQKIKITDFGLARAADDASLTQSGVIAGTPMFMAPEQAQGIELDHRADLFSLGSVLYVMCSGRPPFRAATTLAVLKRVAEDTPRPIREIIAEVPHWLCDAITKLHAKNPEERFGSAQEVADLLGRYLVELKVHGKVEHQPGAQATGAVPVTPAPALGASEETTLMRRPAALCKISWVVKAAAALLVLGIGIGLSETTGVTDLRGAVGRLFAPPLPPVVQQKDADRKASEWMLSIGGAGRIRIKENGENRDIKAGDELPTGAFELTEVNLVNNQKVTDADLAYLKDCKRLDTIAFDHTKIGDAGLAHLKECKNLLALGLTNTEVSDAGLVFLKDCKNLNSLNLTNTKVSDAGLAHLRDCKFGYLYLGGTQVGDAGLVELKEFKGLLSLHMKSTTVTDSGVRTLHRSVPLCKIVWDGGILDPSPGPPIVPTKADGTPIAPPADYASRFQKTTSVSVPSLKINPTQPLTVEGYLTREEDVDKLTKVMSFAGQLEVTIAPPGALGLSVELKNKKSLPIGSSKTLEKGKRYHVAVVYAPGQMSLFLDGKQTTRIAASPLVLADSGGELRLGDQFAGLLDEIRISKSVRYDASFTPDQHFKPDTDTLALYHCDEGTGDVLKDSSGNNHHGKIVGAQWVKADGTTIEPAGSRLVLKLGADSKIDMNDIHIGAGDFTVEGYFTLDAAKTSRSLLLSETLLEARNEEDDNAWHFRVTKRVDKGIGSTSAKGGQPKIGQRTHVAGVKTANELRLFVDGRLVAKEPWSGEVHAQSTQGRLSFHSPGIVEEVRISKVARYTKDFTPAQRHEADKDTLALYHCDEGTGDVLKDSSGNGHHGKIVGAQWVKADGTLIAAPVPAFGLRLGVASSVKVPSLSLEKHGPITMEAFVTPTLLEDQDRAEKALGFGKMLYLEAIGPKLKKLNTGWYFAYGISKLDDSRAGPAPLVGKRRVHLAGVYDGMNLRIFLDGKLIGSKQKDSIAKGLAKKDTSFFIGDGFDGVIEEVRVSKVARYDKDFTPQKRLEPDKDTLALYHFDEGTGDVLNDSSGNKHHGKIVGAQWVKADGSPITPGDPLRNLVVQVIERGGKAFLQTADVPERMADGLEFIPKEPFTIRAIHFDGEKVDKLGDKLFDGLDLTHAPVYLQISSTSVTDVGLAKLAAVPGISRITSLDLAGSAGITDMGLAPLAKLGGLQSLAVRRAPTVSGTGFAAFKGNLESLLLAQIPLTPEGASAIGKIPGLKHLNLGSMELTAKHFEGLAGSKFESILIGQIPDLNDEGLRHLARIETLKELRILDCNLTGKTLAEAQKLKKLDFLGVKSNPKIVEADVLTIAKALPQCKIEWDGGILKPTVNLEGDRKAAEWVLSVGGVVQSNEGPSLMKVAELPAEPIRLTYVNVRANTQVNDKDLLRFKDCRNLQVLHLEFTPISDAGLENFKECKTLLSLNLGGDKVGNNGLAYFKDCKDLKQLCLYRTNVDDAGLVPFKDLKNVTVLALSGSKVSDAGLAHFKNWRNLETLDLNNTAIGDAGLAHLKECTKLTHLSLLETKVTAAKIEELRKAMPKCKIEWDGGVIDPPK